MEKPQENAEVKPKENIEIKSKENVEVKPKRAPGRITGAKIYIQSTFNNTIVTVTDSVGKVLCWSSAGVAGFKGSRKSTPFAASIAAKDAIKKARNFGIKDVDLLVKGPGSGKESAVRSIRSEGIMIRSIIDQTPTPHNGCRPRKRRRV